MTVLDPNGLTRLREAAASRGGKCLADSYVGIQAKYEWECAAGHRWRAKGRDVTHGTWCRECSNQRRSDALRDPEGLSRLQATALSRGGQCLATDYTGMAGTYLFRCRKGHEWQTKGYDVVLNGHWCMRCARQKLRGSLAQLQEVAHARGGKCLATTYLGSQVKVDWECHLGHVWDAIPASVNSGRWCPNCANLRRTQNLRKRKRYDVDG